MNKENFKLIMDSLLNKIKKCEKAFNKVKSTEDLLKLSLEDVIELKKFCQAEYKDMTKIVMVDFYHIIGMGDLTPPQMTKFTFAMRDYLNYRPDITNIEANLDSISKLPQLPTKTKFKLLALCDLTLTKNVRPEEESEIEYEDLETVSTYGETRAQEKKEISSKAPVMLDGAHILVQKDKLAEFFNKLAPSTAHFGNFKDKVERGKPALGISWLEPNNEDNYYDGVVRTATMTELKNKFNL